MKDQSDLGEWSVNVSRLGRKGQREEESLRGKGLENVNIDSLS